MAKKIIDETEVELTLAALPRMPRKETVETVEEWMKPSEALVYRACRSFDALEERSVPAVQVSCSCCEQTFTLERAYAEVMSGCHAGGYGTRQEIGFFDPSNGTGVKTTGDRCSCPYCDTECEVIHVSRIKGEYRIDCKWIGEIHNVRGHLAILAWFCEKVVNKQGATRTVIHLNEGIFIVGGKPYRVCGYQRVMMSGFHYRSQWVKYSRYSDSFGRWCENELLYDPSIIESTDSSNCGLNRLLKDGGKNIRIGAYLWIWCKFPAIENLVTSGHSDLVKAIIEGMTYTSGYYYEQETFRIANLNKVVNTKKVKPHEIMRCEKKDLMLWREMGLPRFLFRGYIYELYGISLDDTRVEQCFNEGIENWQSVLQKHKNFLPPLEKTFNYIDKQKRISIMERLKKQHLSKERAREKMQEDLDNVRRYGSMCVVSPQYLYDYWSMVYKVYNSFPEDLLYPKDLVRMHDEMQKRVKEKEDEALKVKFAERYKKLSAFSYTDETLGLLIRPCETQAEMIAEGAYLHHCVGGYAENHANGGTSIFFIRKIAKPSEPYYTLELKCGKVNQNHGNHNCLARGEVKLFEERWLEHIKTIKIGDQDGKRNSKRVG